MKQTFPICAYQRLTMKLLPPTTKSKSLSITPHCSRQFFGRLSLCRLLIASTAAWCARRTAARSSLLTHPILKASITIRNLIAFSYPCVAAMIECFTALSVMPFFSSCPPRLALASGWPPIAFSQLHCYCLQCHPVVVESMYLE